MTFAIDRSNDFMKNIIIFRHMLIVTRNNHLSEMQRFQGIYEMPIIQVRLSIIIIDRYGIYDMG